MMYRRENIIKDNVGKRNMHFFAFMEHFWREFSAKHLHVTSAAAAAIGRLDEINGNQREMRRKSLVQSWCYVKLSG